MEKDLCYRIAKLEDAEITTFYSCIGCAGLTALSLAALISKTMYFESNIVLPEIVTVASMGLSSIGLGVTNHITNTKIRNLNKKLYRF